MINPITQLWVFFCVCVGGGGGRLQLSMPRSNTLDCVRFEFGTDQRVVVANMCVCVWGKTSHNQQEQQGKREGTLFSDQIHNAQI